MHQAIGPEGIYTMKSDNGFSFIVHLAIYGAIVASIVLYAAYNRAHYDAVCGNTQNYALCQLNLDAGETDIVAHNAGNGIFN
jgi:hypothetical protein